MIYNMTSGPSTLYSNLLRRNTNAELQTRLATAEQELSTGVKSDIYKSLGVGASEALALNATLERDAAQIAANGLLGSRIDRMSSAIGAIRDGVGPAMELALANSVADSGAADGIRVMARAALDTLVNQANATHAGAALFAGAAGDARALSPWDAAANGGQTPQQAVEAITGGSIDSLADAEAKFAELDALFSGDGFDGLFYGGSGDGRQSVGIGDGERVSFGASASDPAFREVLQGLSMLVSVDPAGITDDEAYDAWVGTAASRIAEGMAGLLDSQTQLDAASAQVEASSARLKDREVVYSTRVDALVGVDSYEAATSITALETQLQASYAVTARLSQLSFLNFMS